MSQAVYHVVSLVICVWDIYMLCLFLHAMSIKRRAGRYQFAGYCIAAALVIYGINIQGDAKLNFCAVPVIQLLFCMLAFAVTPHKAVIYTAIFHLMFMGESEIVFEIFYRFLSAVCPGAEVILRFADGAPVYLLEYLFDYVFILFLSKYMRRIEIREDSRFDWCLLIMPVSSFLILLSFIRVEFPHVRGTQILMCGAVFLLYFSNAAVFMLLAHFTQMMNRAKTAELSFLKRDMEKENTDNILKANTVYRKYMHDIHTYFYEFKWLALAGENEAIVEVVDGWERKLEHEKINGIYADNPVFNSLLARCFSTAQEKRIKMDVFIEDAIDIDFIEDVDKISMFGNLFDNAMEAAAECEEGRRKVYVQMFMGNKYFLILKIENTWKKKSWMENGKVCSTKSNAAAHGLGIGIVRELAQKYQGELHLEEQGDWFLTDLMISKSRPNRIGKRLKKGKGLRRM